MLKKAVPDARQQVANKNGRCQQPVLRQHKSQDDKSEKRSGPDEMQHLVGGIIMCPKVGRVKGIQFGKKLFHVGGACIQVSHF